MKNKKILFRYSNIILLLGFIILASLFVENFLSVKNLINILKQSCVLGLLTIGMTFVLLCGHMDLSNGSIMTLTGIVAISACATMPAGAAIALALGTGLLCGALNGAIIVFTHANSGESLMITFGTQLLFSALSLLYTGGFSLPGSDSAFYNSLGMGNLGFISIPILVYIVFTVVLYIIENRSVLGRKIHMIGLNHECCFLSGIKTGGVKLFCYCTSGLLAAAAAIILTSRTLGATPTAGTGYEMDSIVAAVLGGISLSGGIGSVASAFVGVLTLGVLSNAMNLIGFQSFDQSIVKGCVLIIVVAFDVINRKRNH